MSIAATKERSKENFSEMDVCIHTYTYVCMPHEMLTIISSNQSHLYFTKYFKLS